ncbi:MAG: primosomal protein N', partial [Pyrinomonadaceae bacterium]|nr:primosomal protein N' [Pyrinomonadaceae bacterium]
MLIRRVKLLSGFVITFCVKSSSPEMFNQSKQIETTRTRASQVLPQFAEIVAPLGVRQTFTYRLPTSLQNLARLGSRLLVPFRNQQIVGYIVALHDQLDDDLGFDPSKIKDALELIDAEPLLTSQVLQLAQWVADYYATSWGEVLKAALPAGLNATIEQILAVTNNGRDELLKLSGAKLASSKAQVLQTLTDKNEISMRELCKTFDAKTAKRAVRELEKLGWISVTSRALTAQAKPKKQKAVRLMPPENHAESTKKLTEAHEKTVQIIIEAGGEIGFTDLIEEANVSASIINTLEKRGLIETFVREVRRDPLKNAKLPDDDNFDLTTGQTEVLRHIEKAIETSDFKAFLLHGVTGSGKTEVYIRSMRHALEMGKTSLMLVPEIALTPIFSRRLRAHFGETVAILHSSLSTGERFDEWRRIKSGAAKIVIGTRSAIFAPLDNLGVIVVDEEHDGSYRQHEQPFYSARDAAVVRAKFADAVVILGSATPALESFHNANINKYELLTLPKRVGNRPMAQAEIVDMREVFKVAGKDEIFSSQLLEAIEETHNRGEQSIILLNRRGFSQFVLCRSCGESIKCPNCDVTLTFHRRESNLVCHYCNYSRRTPKVCPKCDSKYIFFIGEGTEQIEDILKTKFPDLRIARIDRDTTIRKSLFEETLLAFADKKIDMLVGTQMLAKGHDFPNVTLVGVVSVDAG